MTGVNRRLYRERKGYVILEWERVRELGGDVRQAAFFDWIAYRIEHSQGTDEFSTDENGRIWFRIPAAELSKLTGISEKVVRTTLAKLEEAGQIESRAFALGGAWDQTKSYAPIWADETINPLPSREDAGSHTGGCSSSLTGNSSSTNNPLTNTARDDLEVSFARFYSRYPKKVGKVQALKTWKRVVRSVPTVDREALIESIHAGLDQSIEFWTVEKTERRFIKDPSTWLNAGSWEDELDAPATQQQAYPKNGEYVPDAY